ARAAAARAPARLALPGPAPGPAGPRAVDPQVVRDAQKAVCLAMATAPVARRPGAGAVPGRRGACLAVRAPPAALFVSLSLLGTDPYSHDEVEALRQRTDDRRLEEARRLRVDDNGSVRGAEGRDLLLVTQRDTPLPGIADHPDEELVRVLVQRGILGERQVVAVERGAIRQVPRTEERRCGRIQLVRVALGKLDDHGFRGYADQW